MQVTPGDYAAGLVVILVGAASFFTLYRLARIHQRGEPLLPNQPRRPVPWNGWAPLIMLAPLASIWGRLLVGEAPPDPSSTLVAAVTHAAASAIGLPANAAITDAALMSVVDDLARQPRPWLVVAIAGQGVFTITLALAGMLLLAAVFGARREDLGLPDSWCQFWRDVRLGFTACIAAMAPIYAILILIARSTGNIEQHPLIRELTVNHSAGMMAAAAFTAIIAAPLYEETAFRLVFQGWLENLTTKPEAVVLIPGANEQVEPTADSENSGGLTARPSETEASSLPPSTRINWPPILTSGVLFGLAHVGHGASPIPLVLLGFVHGYLYQRTHRIVPAIASHLLFNSITFILLALQFSM
jgi:membrane protease YdiL (CAAX protease family)